MKAFIAAVLVSVTVALPLAKDCTQDGTSLPVPVHHIRSSASVAAAVQAVAMIERLNTVGSPSSSGLVCGLFLGMSNQNQAADGFNRLHRTKLVYGGFKEWFDPKFVNINGGIYGHTLQYWDQPDDDGWTQLFKLDSQGRDKITKAGCTHAQVQFIHFMVAEVYHEEPNGATITAEGVRDFIATAKGYFPNFRFGAISTLQTTLYCIDDPTCKVPEPRIHYDEVVLDQLVQDPSQLAVPVVYTSLRSQGPIPNPWTGFSWDCAVDAADDGVHMTKPGANHIAEFEINQWRNDPNGLFRPWMFLP